MENLQPAKPFNLDLVVHVLNKTLLSPGFAAMAVVYSYMFQKSTFQSNDLRNAVIYFGVCWSLRFLRWSSRVWSSRSWEHGIAGLLGTNSIRWDDQVAVVTGGSQGLGNAIVTLLRKKGARVAVLDMRIPSKTEWEDDITYYQCDVSDFQRVKDLASQIEQEIGKPTILVNNAGYVSGRPLLDLSEGEIKKTFEVNTLAHFWTLKAFLPSLVANGEGHIVNVASMLGTMGVAGAADYCSSKFAAVGLHDSLKAEVKKFRPKSRIYLTLVLPGQIRTALFANLKPFSPFSAFLLPMLEPHDIAKRIVERIERQQSGELSLPVLVNITWLWRGLPTYATDFLRWISEADESMSQFQKKKAN